MTAIAVWDQPGVTWDQPGGVWDDTYAVIPTNQRRYRVPPDPRSRTVPVESRIYRVELQ